MGENNNEKYMAMRNAESKRALEWMGAYNSNPELAASLLPIFSMTEEDTRFILRTLNSLYDTLYFYKLAIKQPKKKNNNSSKKVVTTIASV